MLFPLKRPDGWRVMDSDTMECLGGPFRHRRKAEQRITKIEQDRRDIDDLCVEFGREKPKRAWITNKMIRDREAG